MNKIIHKDKCGFWILVRYSMIVEDENEGLTEVIVDKKIMILKIMKNMKFMKV